MTPSTPAPFPGDDLELVRRTLARGARPAILSSSGTFTYRDLAGASASVARALLGGRATLDGARIASMVEPGAEWASVQWGVWRAGGVAVPLGLTQPVPELSYVLSDSGAEVVIASRAYADAARAAAQQVGASVRMIEELVDLGGLEGAREARHAAPPARAAAPALGESPASRPALILYTSGTTGRPKGVLISHGNVEAQMRALEAWEWSAEDHIALVLPLHHIHGIANVMLCALWNGARCTVLLPFDAVATWERIAVGDLTLFMAVPTLYQRMIAAWESADPPAKGRWSAGAKHFRLTVSGSASLPVKVLEQWEHITGHRLLERYGMTEIGMGLTNPLHGERRVGHVGQPFPRVEVRLVGEDDEPVPPGAIGEVQVKSPNVFREYWNRPEDTRAAFTADGWFRTGDVGVLEDGSYRLLGRTSVDILKTGGEKVSALEVEEALREHPSIADCAVVGVPDAEWGDRICVALVPRAGAPELTLGALKAWARERLAPWKIPKDMRVLGALPLNSMGKVDKKAVRTEFA